jgi:hypothetical protein
VLSIKNVLSGNKNGEKVYNDLSKEKKRVCCIVKMFDMMSLEYMVVFLLSKSGDRAERILKTGFRREPKWSTLSSY